MFSFINVLGLSIGISACLIICLLVQYEFSFDRHHRDGERIYRVVSSLNFSGTPINNSGVPAPLGAEARKTMTGIEAAAAFHTLYQPKVSIQKAGQEKPLRLRERKGVIYTDQHFFDLFQYQWLAGTPAVLNEPFKVVLSASRAKEYFPDIAPVQAMGHFLTYDDSITVQVAGVVMDEAHNTDIRFKEFIALATVPAKKMEKDLGWDHWSSYNSSSQLFVKLKPGIGASQMGKQLSAMVVKHLKEPYSAAFSAQQELQPLSDLHFNPKYDAFSERRAHKPTLYGLLLVAAFLLILGCINFINLTTAQASQRAKEIGIRKTMGSTRRQLIAQFLQETLALTLLATLLSIALVPLLLKAFADYIPEEVTFQNLLQPSTLAIIIGLVMLVGLLAGSYPALILSRFNPVLVLKNQAYSNTGKTRSAWLRKTLTLSQFVIAQFFIIGTFIVAKQIHYSINKDLGYRKDAIINIQVPWRERSKSKKEALLQRLRTMPGIQQFSYSGVPPASQNTMSSTLTFNDGKKKVEKLIEIRNGDAAYFDIYQIKLLAGKMLQASDTSREYLVNEAYARELGFKRPADIVGKFLTRDEQSLPIVGVVADFHTKSMHQAITPLVFTTKGNDGQVFHLQLATQVPGSNAWQKTLDQLKTALDEIYPDRSFDYTFFDKQIEKFYKAEQSTSKLLTWASSLAIIISCLGLLGLVIYTTHQRVKEIGVRKVLGASATQIVSLLSKDFLVLVVIAFLITAPLAWWAANSWLQNFAYRTALPWWIFAAGGFIMLGIALLTLSLQTIRAALANPVKALRSE